MKFLRIAAIAFVAVLGLPAGAIDFPAKAVHVIAPTAPGGGADVLSHILQPTLQKAWNQELVTVDKAGSRGKAGADFAAAAAPDGYTLLMGSNVSVTERNLASFIPVARVTVIPYVVVVNPLVPAKNVRELIAYAKKNPGKLRYGSSGPGSPAQLAAESFKAQAQVDMRLVESKGTHRTIADLVDGRVDVLFGPAPQVMPYTQNGKLRALASTGLKRPAYLPPGLPTVAEALPGFEAVGWFGVFAPARTPPAIIARLADDFLKALDGAEVKELMLITGAEPSPQGPAPFAAFVAADRAKWAKLARERGIPSD